MPGMTKKEIVQILMSSPHYLELGLKERRQAFEYLYYLYGESIGESGKRSAYGSKIQREESPFGKRDIFLELNAKCGGGHQSDF